MAYFAVTRERGRRWDDSRPMRQQDAWDAHAAFMDGLAAEGRIVLGGPLGDGRRTLLVFDAAAEPEIEAILDADPWTPMDLLRIASIEPWDVLLRGPVKPAR